MISCNLRWCDGHNMFEMYKSCFKHALCCPRCSNKGKLREFLPGGSSFLTIAVDSFGISTSLTSVDMATWSFEGQKTLEKNEPNLPILRHTEKRITKLLGLLLSKLIRRFKDKKSVLLMSYLCAPFLKPTCPPLWLRQWWIFAGVLGHVRPLSVCFVDWYQAFPGLPHFRDFGSQATLIATKLGDPIAGKCGDPHTALFMSLPEKLTWTSDGCGRSNKEAIKFPAIPKWQHLGRTRSD